MADLKISELSSLSGSDLVAADELAIVDDSASETKKITVSNLIANGVTLISDDAIPGAKILFGAGDITTAALADSAVTSAKIGADQVTAAKIADNTIVNLVSDLPTSGDYTGQLALDTDDNSLYVYSGSAWLNTKAPGSVNGFTDTTSGIINISTVVSSGTATITASIDNTASAAQFLAGPVGSGGTVGYRTIDGGDLPTATTTSKGGVIVNGGGLTVSTDTIQIDNSVTASSTKHLVTYDANGLITGGAAITSSDLPVATNLAKGAVSVPTNEGLAVDTSGNLSIDNTVTAGTYTKVTVTSKGVVSAGDVLTAADIPDHSAAKLTSGTINSSRIASGAITAAKLADQSTTKFGGALGSNNVTIFPSGDFKGQFFYDETTQDLYIFTGSAFVPVTVLSGNLVNAGAYNASTNQMSSVTSAGSAAGFSAGAALPAPAVTNLNHYVVVDTSGTGSGAAPAVALAPPDMLLSQGVGTEYSLIDVSNAIAGQTASNISLIAVGDLVATDVQAGIQELDAEKLPKAGGTMTGDLNLGTSTNVVFEGSSADDYETTLTVTNPTADRTITLPNVTGTVVTTGDTGSVTSTMIADGAIVNTDINASAEIAVSKLANGAARQLLQTDSGGSGVEFTSNVDVPGTLDVTSAATFDSTVDVTGLLSANGKLAYPAGTAAAVSLYSGSDTDTGIYSPGSNQFGIATAGTSRIVIDSSGRIGIGTTSPDRLFEVQQNASGHFDAAKFTNGQDNGSSDSVSINFGLTRTGGLAFDAAKIKAVKEQAFTGTPSTINAALVFETIQNENSSERMRIDSSGRLLVGTSSSLIQDYRYSTQINKSGSNVLDSGVLGLYFDAVEPSAGSRATALGFYKQVNTGVVRNNDGLGILRFNGYNGSAYNEAATIEAQVDGAPGSNDMPGRLVFSTTADGASSPTERMRISSTGLHTITASNNSTAVQIRDASNYAGQLVTATDGTFQINARTTTTFTRTGSNTESMRIDSSGRLLVGDTSNSSNAAVQGFKAHGSTGNESGFSSIDTTAMAAGVGGEISFLGNTTTAGEYNYLGHIRGIKENATSGNTACALTFHTRPTATAPQERLRIDSSGNTGIGTTNPAAFGKFVVQGTGNLVNLNATSGKAYQGFYENGIGRFYLSTLNGSEGLAFVAANGSTERMRIDSSGRLLVGTSSARTASIGSNNQVIFEAPSNYFNQILASNTNSVDGSFLCFIKSRGTTAGSHTIVNSGDDLGRISFEGADGAAARAGASIRAQVDGTPGANDMPGRLVFSTTADGASSPTERLRIDNSGTINLGNSSSTFNILTNLNSAARLHLSGGGGGSANIDLHGSTHASDAKTITFDTNSSERMRIHSTGRVSIGTTSQDPVPNNVTGFCVHESGQTQICQALAPVLMLNRKTTDGSVVDIEQDGNLEGSISVSGTTVSYNGGHLARWSQLAGGAERTEILRGSVLSNLDEMCEWGEENNEQLNRMKVSDVEGDVNVSGVFQSWDDDDDTYTNDFFCAMTGDFVIRIAQGTTVARGDLLMSAGDGTAKPQDDDIVRSKTIAKVTSTTVSTTYSDGSYCVPCVLMAC